MHLIFLYGVFYLFVQVYLFSVEVSMPNNTFSNDKQKIPEIQGLVVNVFNIPSFKMYKITV